MMVYLDSVILVYFLTTAVNSCSVRPAGWRHYAPPETESLSAI